METPVECRCGRNPEINAYLRDYKYSISCKCGTDEINFVTWSDYKEKALDNWESLINKIPYKEKVPHLSRPDVYIDTFVPVLPDEDWDNDPLRRYIRRTGGHCSGGGGPY